MLHTHREEGYSYKEKQERMQGQRFFFFSCFLFFLTARVKEMLCPYTNLLNCLSPGEISGNMAIFICYVDLGDPKA